MSYYFNRKGKPISREEWSALLKDLDQRRVLSTGITPNLHVSTIWFGLDHGFGGGPPIIFETMVFEGECVADTRRYSTEEEARAGHAEMVGEQTKRAGH